MDFARIHAVTFDPEAIPMSDDLAELKREVRALKAHDFIKTLKHKYFRAMTFNDYDLIKETLTEDVVTSYSDGEYVFDDREKLLTFLTESHDPNSQVIAYWMAGMPEITLTSDTTATGIWAMYHHYYSRAHEIVDEMFVYYDDEYRLEGSDWKISKTGYRRVINQILNRRDMPYKMKAPAWAVTSGR